MNEAHKRGIKVCLDLVAGHTSDKCQWFKECVSGDRNGRYADYFIWSDSISNNDKEQIALRNKEANPQASTRGKWVELDAKRGKYYQKTTMCASLPSTMVTPIQTLPSHGSKA